jgi:hypothetical protein
MARSVKGFGAGAGRRRGGVPEAAKVRAADLGQMGRSLMVC